MADKSNEALTFGFDIGIASVGWCVLGENRIVDLGVRCFDKAETAKEGESLNLARRTARLMRRRLRRRAWRLTKLARLLKRERLISDAKILQTASAKSPWCLRLAALDCKLDVDEWARALYHLCKHRGFHWISSAEEIAADEDKKEGGPVKRGLADTRRRMTERHYRSAAEMVLAEFPDAQRNKQGAYGKSLSRALLADELTLLFARQRALGNPCAGEQLQSKVTELFWAQKPPLTGEKMLEMLGHCTFEKAEYRAPKASFTAERHVWLTRLNNLKIVVDGEVRRLNDEERRIALPLPYTYETDFTYKRLHDALVNEGLLPASFSFAGLRASKEDKDPLAQTLVRIPAWQELRKTLKKAQLETEWQGMVSAATDGRPELLDDIAWVLSIYKTDDQAAAKLRKLPLPSPDRMVEALIKFPRTSFKAFHALSLKALRKIVPPMEAGLRYDEACQEAGYHHSQSDKSEEKYLPPLYEHARGKGPGQEGRMVFSERIDRDITGGIPRNPVVLRSLNQARKVMNALIRKYGSPVAVHIELARDLSRPLDERRDIEKQQKEYQELNSKVRAHFVEVFRREPQKDEFEKFRLYREQKGKSIYPTMDEQQGICAYSLAPIDLDRLLDPGYVEIDHALPYSRSFDDSKNNKVLAFTKENRDKGNRTPYEFLDGANDSDRWRKFVAFVEATYPTKTRTAKKSRLLRKNFGKEEASDFKARNLNDTRYICKFYKNYVERYLQLAPRVGADGTAEKAEERCVVLSGQLTAFLRARWGLLKIREESDRHHALDAAVVAACSHAMVKRLADHSRRKELEFLREGFPDPESGVVLNPAAHKQLAERFPEPWVRFRHELEARLKTDSAEALRADMARLGTYPPEALETLRPLFISRAPQRRNSGALHKETIYGENRRGFGAQTTAINRKAVTALKERDLDKIVGAHEPRNEGLIKSLRQWLQSQDIRNELVASLGKGKDKREPTEDEKRRMEELSQLPRKPLKSDPENGPFKGPPITKVKMIETQKSGAYVRNGIAELGQVVSTKLYRHGDEFLFLPRYELPDESLFGLTPIPADAVDTGVELYGNDVVKIEHPNLSHCYRAVRTYKDDETGEKLIDVVSTFSSGIFLGYWAYFEPSNNRPVILLHDSAKFFLLEANKETRQQAFTLIAKKKKGKDKDEGDDAYEYLEKSPPMERQPFKFSLEANIKRQIGSAISFERLHVDVLGNIYSAPPEQRRGLA